MGVELLELAGTGVVALALWHERRAPRGQPQFVGNHLHGSRNLAPRNRWNASVNVTVHDAGDNPVSGSGQTGRDTIPGPAIAGQAVEQNKRVLVLLTDVTAFADALKEIGVAMERVPSNRGYMGDLYSQLALRYEDYSDFGSTTNPLKRDFPFFRSSTPS